MVRRRTMSGHWWDIWPSGGWYFLFRQVFTNHTLFSGSNGFLLLVYGFLVTRAKTSSADRHEYPTYIVQMVQRTVTISISAGYLVRRLGLPTETNVENTNRPSRHEQPEVGIECINECVGIRQRTAPERYARLSSMGTHLDG